MAFKLDVLKKPNMHKLSKHISSNGIEITLKIEKDEARDSAIDKIQPNGGNVKIEDLKREKQGLSNDTKWLYVIGEYAIEKWNVVDADDIPLPPNGNNLILLLNSLPPKQSSELMSRIFSAFFTARLEYQTIAGETVKKPSTGTSGKKSNQRSRQTESKATDD